MDSHENGKLGVNVAWILGEGHANQLTLGCDFETKLWEAESFAWSNNPDQWEVEKPYCQKSCNQPTLSAAVSELRRLIVTDGG